MKNKFLKIIFTLALVLHFLPIHHADAQLANLQSVYTLTGATAQPIAGTSESLVSVTGTVTSVDSNSPDTVQIRFLYQKSDGSGPMYQDSFFTPAADGTFVNTIGTVNPLLCGEDYNFFLYEFPDLPIQYVVPGNQTPNPGFSLPINCNIAPQAGDIFAPDSAQAMWIDGVNWGTVTTTDRSISINGAHLIPILPHGPRTFRIEYGTGVAGQASYGAGHIGESAPLQVNNTMSPPYSFNRTILSLAPNTDYYYNIFELGTFNGNPLEGNLYVYGFATTARIVADEVEHTFTAGNTGIRVYGRIINSGNGTLMNYPVNVLLAPAVGGQPQLPPSYTVPVTTGASNNPYGSGFFEVNMGPVTPGESYYILIQYQSNNRDIIEPILVTVPTVNTNGNTGGGGGQGGGGGGGGGGGQTQITAPTYNGLVTCDGGPSDPCDFNDFVSTINRVIDFLIKYIAFPLVAIVIAWAGIKLLVSGGSSEAKSSAKKMIGKVVVGLIIALLSWVIIKLILVTLGYVPTGILWGLFGMQP